MNLLKNGVYKVFTIRYKTSSFSIVKYKEKL